jgi:hypothetical protein
MQDNFNIHEWQLNRAINEIDKINEDEIGLSDILARNLFKLQGKISDDLFYKLRKAINSQDPTALAKAKEIMSRIKPEDDRIYMGEEKGQCPECGCKMEAAMCNECGYMEEATFTDKHDNNPELKGGQKDLPDELQAGILKKEGMDHENSLEDIISDMLKYMSKEEILQHFKQMLANNLNEKADRKFEVDDIVKVKGTGKKGKVVDMSPSETFFIVNIDGKNSSFHESDLELIKRPSLNENTDHEVSMAQASLKSIISSASELMNKIGNEEINLPGWIQGHITNAENYIDQANQGYHELEPSVKDINTMDMVTEEVSANKKIKAKNALAIHLRSAMEDGNKENIEQVKDARDRINNTKSVDELVNILGEFGYKDDEIEDILG